MMKILILTGIFPPDLGGPATQIDAFCQELTKRQIEVAVLTFGEPSSKQYPYKITRVSRRVPKIIRNLIFFWRAIWLARYYDLVYAQDLYTAGLSALLVSKFWRKKMFVRFAGDSAWELAQSKYGITDDILSFQSKRYGPVIELRKWSRRLILVGANGVVAVSNFMRNLAITIGSQPDRVRTIYNSVDFQTARHPESSHPHHPEFISGSSKITKSNLGLVEGRPILITAARLVPWKNMGVFISLMPELLKKYRGIYLLILGIGSEEDKLKKMARNLNVEDNVRFLGKVPQGEVSNYFSLADIFVLNTNYEGLSHTLLEAMAAGLPVITTNVGGNPEVVINNQNGLLVEYNNTDQWFQALSQLLDSQSLRQKFAEEGIKRLTQFSWEKLINEVLAFFKFICSLTDSS